MLLAVAALPAQDTTNHKAEREQMRRAQANPTAFAPLYEAYVDRVYAFCRRRSNSDAEAEDLCSQVFTRVLVGLPTYNGGMVAAWIFRVARNVVANHLRGRKPILSLDRIEIPSEGDITYWVERDDDRRILMELFNALPENKRELLSLALDSGLTSAAIGQIIGKDAGAVRVELHRIIAGLRERYFRLVEGEA
ncbi:MAG: sigma-70 family RNA polymerase sigma factor [Anaerolineaceae bacterium]|nr:sigma-70 family RNA polymerase sigma factor [Anaerolineaceae bacterium]